MPFGMLTSIGPWIHVLDNDGVKILAWKGAFYCREWYWCLFYRSLWSVIAESLQHVLNSILIRQPLTVTCHIKFFPHEKSVPLWCGQNISHTAMATSTQLLFSVPSVFNTGWVLCRWVIVTIYFREIKHHFTLPKVNKTQNLPNAIFLTLCQVPTFLSYSVYSCRQITFSADSAQKAPTDRTAQ